MTTSPYFQRRSTRFDPTINWRDTYAERLATPEMAAAMFNSGDHLWIPPGHASLPILEALVARSDELEGVEVRGIVVPDAGWFTEDMMGAFSVAPQFGTLFDRDAVNSGIADYHPYWLVGIHKAWDAGREDEAWPIDVLQIRTTQPNEAGFVSLGGSVWDGVTSAKRAKKVIAEVNDNVIETFGDSWLHVSEIDCFVPNDSPVMVNLEFPEPNQVDLGLAHNVGQLVQDGDTIQVGVGSHSGALARLGTFDERENLSYFAELTTEGLVPLVERGVITGKYSKTHPDKFVATMIGNTPDEHAVVHRNPAFEAYSIEYLLDPRQIARNETSSRSTAHSRLTCPAKSASTQSAHASTPASEVTWPSQSEPTWRPRAAPSRCCRPPIDRERSRQSWPSSTPAKSSRSPETSPTQSSPNTESPSCSERQSANGPRN